MGKRGWTTEQIQQSVNNPVRTVVTRDTRAIDKGGGLKLNDPATAYYGEDGAYIVVNDKTKDAVQIVDKTDPFWKAPWEK